MSTIKKYIKPVDIDTINKLLDIEFSYNSLFIINKLYDIDTIEEAMITRKVRFNPTVTVKTKNIVMICTYEMAEAIDKAIREEIVKNYH